ncbi:MAG TPA: serine/threonine-protein kinase [Burkholderiaceae bacterium]|nr:serine/threonine-protein kinase [Burkholderiaceae bacterium]
MSTVTPPPTESQHALPLGLRLDEFEIRSVLGVGGFGIVYHAFDHALERDVAIKEYMPSSLASRSRTLHVSLLSQGHAETFALGLKSFVNEARLLARFDHPSLVKVHRFWEANGTAYMVMPLYRGRTLKALRAGLSESPSEAWLRRLLEPLLGALDVLHAEGVFHRDIAPDNILVGDDGRPVLLDFGAARRVISDQSQTLTAILKPSYAPIEQYAEAAGLRQGAWTDLYALGATLCFAVTGRAPQPATARALGTERHLLAAEPRRGLSHEFLQLIDWMMAPRPEHRPQSVAALREVLDGRAAAPVPPAPTPPPVSPVAWEPTLVPADAADAPGGADSVLDLSVAAPAAAAAPTAHAPARSPRWPVAFAVLALVGVAAAAAWQFLPQDAPPAPTAAAQPVLEGAEPASRSATPPAAAMLAPAAVEPPTPAASMATPPSAPAVATAAAVTAPRPRRAAPSVPPDAPGTTAATPATEPAAPSPVAVAATPRRPRDLCDGRLLIALHRCLKRVCQDPALSGHRDCQRMRQVEAGQARAEGY